MHYLAIVIAALVMVVAGIGTASILHRLKVSDPWVRKISHVGVTLVIVAGALFFNYRFFFIIGLLCAGALLAIKFIHPPKALHNKEARDSYGEVFYFVGVAATSLLANSTEHFIIPVAILGLADTAAYIFGKSMKSPKLFKSKTLAGTTAFAIVAFLLLLCVTPWWVALGGAIITAGIELVGLWGSDNLTVPVVATLLLYL